MNVGVRTRRIADILEPINITLPLHFATLRLLFTVITPRPAPCLHTSRAIRFAPRLAYFHMYLRRLLATWGWDLPTRRSVISITHPQEARIHTRCVHKKLVSTQHRAHKTAANVVMRSDYRPPRRAIEVRSADRTFSCPHRPSTRSPHRYDVASTIPQQAGSCSRTAIDRDVGDRWSMTTFFRYGRGERQHICCRGERTADHRRPTPDSTSDHVFLLVARNGHFNTPSRRSCIVPRHRRHQAGLAVVSDPGLPHI